MTVALGVMQLPVTQDADRVRDYLNGTIAGGGLWTALTRSSNHDHTGGVNGTPLSIAAIPDGSITTAKLDPAVLLPYALVDGSKPFTGQVALNGDAIVRNTLYFGAKPAGVADATLARTGAGALRVDTNLGVGVTPAAWGATLRALQTGGVGAVWSGSDVSGAGAAYLSVNTYHDGTNFRGIGTSGGASTLALQQGGLAYANAPAVAAGATQTFAQRLVVGATGTLTLSPDAGQDGLKVSVTGGGLVTLGPGLMAAPSGRVASANYLELQSGAAYILPSTDNTNHLGGPSNRFIDMYAVVGSINTCHVSMKRDFALLDPAACVAAVTGTDWLSFAYIDPMPPELVSATDGETPEQAAEREQRDADALAAHQRRLADTADSRKSKGYVLESPDYRVSDLFGMADRKSGQATADLAVVACALQDALRRLAVLEGKPN